MYRSASEVWSGLAKNATEGLGDPARIGPVSVALLLGQVLPFLALFLVSALMLFMILVGGSLGMDVHFTDSTMGPIALGLFGLATAAAWIPRWLGVWRFYQDWRGALLHPIGILLLISVQWYALVRKVRGGAVSWRDRAYVGE
jgi:hypothetical protein